MSIPVHHLSQVLNDRLQQNFFDFVNSYRVEEVRRRISEPSGRTLTLMAIALDAGFNSKSVFNTAFRKYTCMTPSEFRKKAIEEEKASEK
jgi:AraC-like DNA-binding protein